VIWNSAVEEICGSENPSSVTHVRLKNLVSGETSDYKTDGVFIAIGHKPSTELFVNQLPLNASGYIITEGRSTATAIPGVYAAGDVTDDIYRQAVTAAGMGCMAALEVERWLAAQEHMREAAE
jgi:thioredoxin reductase (NADPH)